MRTFIIAIFSFVFFTAQQKTYCNPINIDYGYTPIPNFATQGKHRATADPVIVNFKGKYYLFSTNQWGYWWSDDMLNWNFISRKFLKPDANVYDELCAPAVFEMNNELYVIGSTHSANFILWKSKDPTKDNWEIAVDQFKVGAWDPAFLYDKDLKKLFLYWGSSNEFPLYGTEINTKTLQSEGYVKPLMSLHPDDHGWERFGEYNYRFRKSKSSQPLHLQKFNYRTSCYFGTTMSRKSMVGYRCCIFPYQRNTRKI